MKSEKFYITTPIYYVNDRPHIGHAYTTVVADAYARFYREKLGQENVFFLTGTDEHGTKVAESATKNNLEPQVYTDKISEEYKKVWSALNISNDQFIRTTDPEHEKVVGEFLTNLYDKGFIYKGSYKGFYCVGCEKFLSFEEIKDGVCIQHPKSKLVEQEEENYFFKLGDFSAQVLEKIESGELEILPIERRNEVVGKIKQGINDVSVSRPGVSWGIPLPWDKNHTVYVWVDALINYYSALKISGGDSGGKPGGNLGARPPSCEKFWPPSLHLLAKDILWFHALVWPSLLLASDLPLPKQVFAHGFFTIDGQKMSKSIGNVIDPMALISEYGVDATRYLLLSAFTFGSDGDISLSKFKEKFNADLANGLGNLVSRVAKLAEKFEENPAGKAKEKIFAGIQEAFEINKPDQALKIIFDHVHDLDQKIALEKPWTKDGDELKNLLKVYIEELVAIGLNLKPFLPETSETIIKIFTAEKIVKPEGLFSRK